jgi:hypothetical protein
VREKGKKMILTPKNWSVFQHYKDRCPPWIKLHRDLLNDRIFMRLPLASKALAPMLWLLASESKDGHFDGSQDELVFRLHITDQEYISGIKPLIDNGFFIIASGVLAECKQVAIPETETEREAKAEKKKTVATKVARPELVSSQVWEDWLSIRRAKKLPLTDTAWTQILAEIDKSGHTVDVVIKECCLRGWAAFKVAWLKENPISATPAQAFAGDI